MTNQPNWECIAQLGDAHPIDHGGYWIFRDTTGAYCEEAEYLEVPEDEDGEYRVYRFILARCTFINGVLSDNKFHPQHCAWFATTACVGMDEEERLFCSGDPIERAEAYRAIGDYHGFDNLDQYPLTLTREEAEARYAMIVKAA